MVRRVSRSTAEKSIFDSRSLVGEKEVTAHIFEVTTQAVVSEVSPVFSTSL